VSLATPPVLTESPVCLTCDLNAQNLEFWGAAAWSRDGLHLSAYQRKYEESGVSYAFYIFDVTFAPGSPPVLVPTLPIELPGFVPLHSITPNSWAHLSDSLTTGTDDPVDGTYGLVRYEIDLESNPKAVTGTTVLTEGIGHHFMNPVWSSDDQQLVEDSGGIQAITIGPPLSMKLIASDKPRMVDAPDWKPLVP
jgi:hypothetical protein